MNCGKCQSDNTQRAELIYEQGTSDIKTRSTSIGVISGGGGLGLGTARTSTTGTSQSKLAKKLAPPKRIPSAFAGIAAIALILCSLGASNGSIGPLTIASLLVALLCIVYAIRWELAIKPKMFAGWRGTWHCNRCGSVYSETGAFDAYNKTTATTKLWTGVTGLSAIICFMLLAAQSGRTKSNSVQANNQPAFPSDADIRGTVDHVTPKHKSQARKSVAKKPSYTVRITVPLTVTGENGRVICEVPGGTEVHTAGNATFSAGTQAPVLASAYVSDLCPAEPEPRDGEHIRSFRATIVRAAPTT